MSKINEYRNEITRALVALNEVCDGARSWDGAGFNKFDTGFGKELAERSFLRALTEKELYAALKMMRKYRKQLEGNNIQLPLFLLDEPVETVVEAQSAPVVAAEKKARISIKLNNQLIEIYFASRPNDEELAAVKSLPERRWMPALENRPWVVPAKYVEAVLSTMSAFNAEIDPAVVEFAAHPPSAPVAAEQKSISITLENETIFIRFIDRPNSADIATIKELPERRWLPNVDGKPWTVPTRFASDIYNAFQHKAQFSAEFIELMNELNELASMSNKSSSDFEVEGLKGGELMPFQKAGVEFVEKADGKAIVADEMGLGKTIQAIAFMQLHPEMRPAVIIVPASLKLNWAREISKWMSTNDKVLILEGRSASSTFLKAAMKSGVTIFIINYDILSYWVEAFEEISLALMIADEAHYCKNMKAQRSKAVKELAKSISKVLLMTGTPVTNRPIELFPLLNMINPKAWSNFFQFAKRYTNAQHNGFGWDFSDASNLEELHNAIKPYVIRRVKEQVLNELPDKRRSTLVIEFDEAARAEYIHYITEAMKHASKAAEALVFIEKAKQAAVKGKLSSSLDWIENFIESNGKLVVFATHKFVIDELMKRFQNSAVKVDGSVSMEARQAAVDKFQNDPETKLFVGNIKAAGVGLTLTAASDVAFLEFAWTPGDHTQAEDRCHRIGQKNSVNIYYLVANGTIDETIVKLIESKRQIIETISDGKVTENDFSMIGELLHSIGYKSSADEINEINEQSAQEAFEALELEE